MSGARAARAEIRLHKCLTTPADPAAGALAGLAELIAAAGISLGEIDELIHGTTLVTNALIERRGARWRSGKGCRARASGPPGEPSGRAF